MDFSQILLPGERLSMAIKLRRSNTDNNVESLRPQTTSQTSTLNKSLNETSTTTAATKTSTASNVGKGIYSLGQGFLKGMTGVVSEPYRGVASGGGLGGLVKGLGKGAVGLITSPVMGAMQGVGEVIGYPVIQPALAPSEFESGMLVLTSYRLLWIDRPPYKQDGSKRKRKRVRQMKDFPLAMLIEADIIEETSLTSENLHRALDRKLRVRSKDGQSYNTANQIVE